MLSVVAVEEAPNDLVTGVDPTRRGIGVPGTRHIQFGEAPIVPGKAVLGLVRLLEQPYHGAIVAEHRAIGITGAWNFQSSRGTAAWPHESLPHLGPGHLIEPSHVAIFVDAGNQGLRGAGHIH